MGTDRSSEIEPGKGGWPWAGRGAAALAAAAAQETDQMTGFGVGKDELDWICMKHDEQQTGDKKNGRSDNL